MEMFNFGENWLNYSKRIKLDNLEEAKKSLIELLGNYDYAGKDFLDIGCGSGLFSIAAKIIGFRKVVGIDISAESVWAAEFNKNRFLIDKNIEFVQKSIFDVDGGKLGQFDVVYSWGVLHHTGDMYQALRRSFDFVAPGGLFIVAIYNKHWSSPFWEKVKFFYNVSPGIIKKIIIFIFWGVIFAAKFLITLKNPLRKKRGMNFYYDVVDWVGGYPYEYASKKEIVSFFIKNGFKLTRFKKAVVPTGCNEYIFAR